MEVTRSLADAVMSAQPKWVTALQCELQSRQLPNPVIYRLWVDDHRSSRIHPLF